MGDSLNMYNVSTTTSDQWGANFLYGKCLRSTPCDNSICLFWSYAFSKYVIYYIIHWKCIWSVCSYPSFLYAAANYIIGTQISSNLAPGGRPADRRSVAWEKVTWKNTTCVSYRVLDATYNTTCLSYRLLGATIRHCGCVLSCPGCNITTLHVCPIMSWMQHITLHVCPIVSWMQYYDTTCVSYCVLGATLRHCMCLDCMSHLGWKLWYCMYVVHTMYINPKKNYYKIVVCQVLEMCFVTFSGGNQLHRMRSL